LNNVADTKVQVWGVERVIHVQGQRIRGQDNVVNDLLPKYALRNCWICSWCIMGLI